MRSIEGNRTMALEHRRSKAAANDRQRRVPITRDLLMRLNASGMTQKQAAALCGTSQPRISKACDDAVMIWLPCKTGPKPKGLE